MSPYVYAGNDPVNGRDPTGLVPHARWDGRYYRGRLKGWGLRGASAYEAALAEWETEQFLAFWHYEWEQTQQALGAAREWVSDNQQCLAASGGAALSPILPFQAA
jgi:hypothetical protein